MNNILRMEIFNCFQNLETDISDLEKVNLRFFMKVINVLFHITTFHEFHYNMEFIVVTYFFFLVVVVFDYAWMVQIPCN